MPNHPAARIWAARKVLIAILASSAGMVGSAPASANLFSATGPVIAILGGELFIGEAEGHLDGSGTLGLRSQKNPGLTCVGEFTSSATQGGSGELRCSDSSRASFHFVRLTISRGHGSGSFSRGSLSFSYGLTAEEAKPYLILPQGKKLVNEGTALEMVDL